MDGAKLETHGRKDIRWEQRFSNFKRAMAQLEKAVNLAGERELSDLEKQGLIQGFEVTHELAWKMMKDFIGGRGNVSIYGSKDATREAFQLELIEDGDGWMSMIKSRNQTSHTYNEEVADEITHNIIHQYFKLFVSLRNKMESPSSDGKNETISS